MAVSKPALALLLALSALAVPRGASAQEGTDAAAAEALYREGSAEMEAGNYASACPKLDESFRLDPATGALLTLAACYERSGKVASAWVRYLDVESRATKEGDKDREAVAKKKAGELVSRLPRVTITLAPAVASIAGVEVRRDQTLLTLATLSSALPVDPGRHVVEVTAPGYAPERREILAAEGRTDQVRFDALTPSPSPTQPAVDEGDEGLSGMQIGGIVVGSAGLVALGVGFGFGAIASGATSDLEEMGDYAATGTCPPSQLDACREKFDSASSASTVSTALVIGGSVLAAAGVVMILVGGSSGEHDTAVVIAPTLGGGRLEGTF